MYIASDKRNATCFCTLAIALLVVLTTFLSSAAAGEVELDARPVSDSAILLKWPSGHRLSGNSVVLERKSEDGGAFERVTRVNAENGSYLDRGLDESKTYTYRLRLNPGGRYDFGPGSQPADGYTRVRITDTYDEERGYGIVPGADAVRSRGRDRGGSGEQRLETLVFHESAPLEFKQKLPNGEYVVSLASGDTDFEASASVKLNGQQVVPMTNTDPGEFVTLEEEPVEVTGGSLTVEVSGTNHSRLNVLEIQAVEEKVVGSVTARTRSLSVSPGETTYYVDPSGGDNAAEGTTPQQAWKSLAPVNAMKLAPGDRVLLKSGCTFTGPLAPEGSGTEDQPIVVASYGEGDRPVVAGGGEVENTVRLHNQQHWTIRDLTITNTDGGSFYEDEGREVRRGVYVTARDAGDVEGIHLENLEIRDVRGVYYRYEGSNTNGGIICRVLGEEKPTRFVDLHIEDCVFRTWSIERYPVVVTSSGNSDPASGVVWEDNRMDHTGRAHFVIPAREWPREKVYYYDPEAKEVFALDKHAPPISPLTGRVGCEDIFSEIAARLRHSWTMLEATRAEEGRWLFTFSPGDDVPTTVMEYDETFGPRGPLGFYAELRAAGFMPPWLDPDDNNLRQREDAILEEWIDELVKLGINRESNPTVRNRVFMNEPKWARPRTNERFLNSLSQYGVKPDLSTRKKALKYFKSLPWEDNPYSACGRIGHVLKNHVLRRKQEGKDPRGESYYYVKKLINDKFRPEKGYWGGSNASHANRADGVMKMLVPYVQQDWEIPRPKKIIDFILSGATEEKGFEGNHCSSFNQMWSLANIRRKYPELSDYRGAEIDRYTAMTFQTFLDNWQAEHLNFYRKNWGGKANNAVPLFMAQLLLDMPFWRSSTIYNWREGPIITRHEDGSIELNSVIYRRKGYPFAGLPTE